MHASAALFAAALAAVAVYQAKSRPSQAGPPAKTS
jgi:hypothetical protein